MEYWAFKSLTKLDWIRGKFGWNKTVLDVGSADDSLWTGMPFKGTTLDREIRDGDEPCHPDFIGEAEKLPFEDNSFDIVVLAEILEHLETPSKAIAEALRVAKLKVVLTLPWEAKWNKAHRPFTNPEHIHLFSPETICELVEKFKKPYEVQIFEFNGMVWIGVVIYCNKGVI